MMTVVHALKRNMRKNIANGYRSIVIPQFLWETVTRKSRPRTGTILTIMEELQDSEYGHLVTLGKTKEFIKKFQLDSEKFKCFEIPEEMYCEKCKKVIAEVSNKQKAKFVEECKILTIMDGLVRV